MLETEIVIVRKYFTLHLDYIYKHFRVEDVIIRPFIVLENQFYFRKLLTDLRIKNLTNHRSDVTIT